MGQVAVYSGVERRRRWDDETRLKILSEAFAPGANIAQVARRHDVSTGQIYTWRRKLLVQEREAQDLLDLHTWLTAQFARLSRNHDLAKAINYMLRRWHAFTLFLGDGRVCLTNNAAERALRCVPLGRKAWLFCGSDRGGQRAAILYTLIQTARLNDVDPQAWLADVLARIADQPMSRLDQLLQWDWQPSAPAIAA